MEREQIIKALECCSNRKMDCDSCPYSQAELADNESCAERMEEDAITIIKELTEEKEDLAKRLVTIHDMAVKKERELTEENERLRAENKLLESQYETMYDSVENTLRAEIADCGTSCKWCEGKVKADTVRKMQSEIKERCIKGGIYPVFVASTIDQIAKELVGE